MSEVQGIKATSGVQAPLTITTDKNPVNQPIVNPPITVPSIEILSGGVAKNLELLCKTTWLQYDSLITVPLQGTSGSVILNVPMFGEYLSKPAKLYLLMGDRFMGSVMYRITLFGASTIIGGLEIGTTVHYFDTPTINDLRVIEGKTIAANGSNVYTFTLGPIVPNTGVKQHFFTTHDRAILDSFPDVSTLDWSDFPHFVLLQNIPLQANISSEISTVYMRVETMLSPDFAVINTNVRRLANIYNTLIAGSSLKMLSQSIDGMNGATLGKIFNVKDLYISKDGFFDIGEVDNNEGFSVPYYLNTAIISSRGTDIDGQTKKNPYFKNGTWMWTTNLSLPQLMMTRIQSNNVASVYNADRFDVFGFLTYGSTSPSTAIPIKGNFLTRFLPNEDSDMDDVLSVLMQLIFDELNTLKPAVAITELIGISGELPNVQFSILSGLQDTNSAFVDGWQDYSMDFRYGSNGLKVTNGADITYYIPYSLSRKVTSIIPTLLPTGYNGDKTGAFFQYRLATASLPKFSDINFTSSKFIVPPSVSLFKKVPEGCVRLIFTQDIPHSVSPAITVDGIPTAASLRPVNFPEIGKNECFAFDIITPQNLQTVIRCVYSGYYNAFFAKFSTTDIYSVYDTRDGAELLIRNFVRTSISQIPSTSLSTSFVSRVITPTTLGPDRSSKAPYIETIPRWVNSQH